MQILFKTIVIFFALYVINIPILATSHKSSFQLMETTIPAIHSAMQADQLSCVELINQYLNRIKKYNLSLSKGAPINAFVSLNPNIINEAETLDHYYARTGHFKGPMHCIPIIVKDNIDTVDTPSTSGSLALLGSQPVTNAFLVQKLRDAGAIIIGKGAMDEFASGMQGISSKSGRVGNAYDPNQNPGGSSGGPAAAVSANFAMVGIGTDNSGSVRIPAAYNGLYGLRPSTGLISQSGIFPRGNLDGVAGVMARTVKDLAITLSVIANSSDPNDPKTRQVSRRIGDYTTYLNPNALQGQRIGIITSVAGKKTFDTNNKDAMAIFNHTFANLRQYGVTLIKVQLPKFDSDRENNMAGEIQDVDRYLASFPSTRQNYHDICTSKRTYTFGSEQDCLSHLKETAIHNSKAYKKVLATFKKNREYIEHIMKTYKLTALLMPLNAKGGPSYDITHVNTWRVAVSSNSGLPAITIIGGYTKTTPAMPVGLELIGKRYGEAELLALAYSYGSHQPSRQIPQMPETLKANKLPMMTIPQINNLFTVIGYKAFKKYLAHRKNQEIPAQAFAKVVKQELDHFNQQSLQ